jgi:hypothetical protein
LARLVLIAEELGDKRLTQSALKKLTKAIEPWIGGINSNIFSFSLRPLSVNYTCSLIRCYFL